MFFIILTAIAGNPVFTNMGKTATSIECREIAREWIANQTFFVIQPGSETYEDGKIFYEWLANGQCNAIYYEGQAAG